MHPITLRIHHIRAAAFALGLLLLLTLSAAELSMDRDRVIRNWDGEEGLPAGNVPARAGTPDAYLLKRTGRDELLAAIRQVGSGGSPMSSQIARKVVRAFHQPAQVENDTGRLSVRGQEEVALLAKNLLHKEIAT